MACGTPVITSNTSALPEVAGDATLLVDPIEVNQIAEAMRRIICDTSLRQRLRNLGLAQAKQFSWAATNLRTQGLLGYK
jgi:glycosyltransferase involved in cell wall biosynthesis